VEALLIVPLPKIASVLKLAFLFASDFFDGSMPSFFDTCNPISTFLVPIYECISFARSPTIPLSHFFLTHVVPPDPYLVVFFFLFVP